MNVYNELGVVAESYDELQGIPLLSLARTSSAFPAGSPQSFVRTVFQAAEIALHNLADLTDRAATDLRTDPGKAVVKLSWAHDFHRLLTRVSRLPVQAAAVPASGAAGTLRICDSPAFRSYLAALRSFDTAVADLLDSGALALETVLADETLDSNAFRLMHLARTGTHQARTWERNLARVPVAEAVPGLEEVVGAEPLRRAVFGTALRGDTFFTQFRALHQIPEVLGAEACDLLEVTIRRIRGSEPAGALAPLRAVAAVCDVLVESIHPLASNLSTSDYHRIRENLGLTSGSHSVGLRYELFGDLYRQMGDALMQADQTRGAGAPRPDGEERAIVWEAVRAEALRIGWALGEWREAHLHLPRNALGGDGTTSLSGSPDGLRAAEAMLVSAQRHDPLRPLLQAVRPERDESGEGTPLSGYLDSDASLDRRILDATGRITRQRFRDVQQRTGHFSRRCPFTPPPHRIV